MVQILPYVQSPLEQLTPYLANAAGAIGQGIGSTIKQRSALKGLQSLLNPTAAANQQPTETQPGSEFNPVNIGQIAQFAETLYGKDAAGALTDTLIQQQKSKEKEASQIRSEQRKEQAELKKSTAEKKEYQQNIQKTFNAASSMLQKNLPGIGISPLTKVGVSREGVENRAAFNNLKGKFESILLPLESKGALSKPRFDFIISQVPKASDTQRVIAGKLRGLAETLSQEGFPIDTSILNSIPWASEDLKNLGQDQQTSQKVEPGTKLTQDIAKQLLESAGNDKSKARQLAKEMGYEF